MWRCLENIRGLVGVPALWRSWLGGDFGAFRGAFLRQRPERAESYLARTCAGVRATSWGEAMAPSWPCALAIRGMVTTSP